MNTKVTIAAVAAIAALGIAVPVTHAEAAPAAHQSPERQLVFQVTVPGGKTLTEVCAFQSQTAANTFYVCGYQTRK